MSMSAQYINRKNSSGLFGAGALGALQAMVRPLLAQHRTFQGEGREGPELPLQKVG